jgi:IS30 family transposase
MTYNQLTPDERYTIASMRAVGRRPAEIARVLGRHRSTICREIKRNCCKYDGNYRVHKAQSRTNGRRRMSRQGRHHSPKQYRTVEKLLAEKWSPEQISFCLPNSFGFYMSYQTIYQHIRRDQKNDGSLYLDLRQGKKIWRKRFNSVDYRGKLPGRRPIEERPYHVELRREIGHWEIDTVMGKESKDCIVTLVERVTKFTLIGKLQSRTKEELNRRVISLIRQHAHLFKTITADNGSEFHGYKKIEAATGVLFYFANPYQSWQRGLNENTNGLIRQYIPKGTSMQTLTQWDCTRIAKSLNTRPRKTLGFQTPEQRFYGF